MGNHHRTTPTMNVSSVTDFHPIGPDFHLVSKDGVIVRF